MKIRSIYYNIFLGRDVLNNNKRLYYLDSARGFALLSVIIGHIYQPNNALITWIYSFHVPLFFIISGILLYYKDTVNKSFLGLISSRIKSILIPYLMFCLVNIIFEIILNPSLTTIKWTILQTITFFGIGATWFLPALFISEIIFILINKYINSKFIKFVITSILITIPCIFKSNNIILTVMFRSLTSLGFISIGYYIFPYINKVDLSWVNILCIFITSILLSGINGNVDLYSLKYNNPIIYLLCGVIGSVLILFTLKKFNNFNSKYLTYFGLNSIVIMATHQNIIKVCQIVSNNNLKDILGGTLLLITIIILEIPLVYIVNKYLPFMLGRLNCNKQLV